MSYIRLNIIDQTQTISGEVHGSVGDAVVAALAAEPETVDELALALARFVKPQSDQSPFHWFQEGENLAPYDAGILVVDLAARIVAVDSTYSLPSAEGYIHIQSEFSQGRVAVPYHLSDDWLFVHSIPEYEGVCKKRRDDRRAIEPLDAREVLYGKALSEFIACECSAARNSTDENLPAQIHAKWLMSARADLHGKTPREVLLDRREWIDFDLHSRQLQWSFTGECPPPLPLHSNAYARAGFGTHERVVYYDLIRYLIGECLESLQAQQDISPDREMARLEELKPAWLDKPNWEYSGKTPSHILEWERRRMPVCVPASDAVVDADCPVCEAMAGELESPMFWHLDGSSMDDCFEFSAYRTREEWEAEQKRWEEFNREFERNWKAGKRDISAAESPMRSDDGDEPLSH